MDLIIRRNNPETGAIEFLSEVLRAAKETKLAQHAQLVDTDNDETIIDVMLYQHGGDSYDYDIARAIPCSCGCSIWYATGTWYTVTNLKDRLFTLGMVLADHRNAERITELNQTVDALTNRINELETSEQPKLEWPDQFLLDDALDALIREVRRSAEQSVTDYQERFAAIKDRFYR